MGRPLCMPFVVRPPCSIHPWVLHVFQTDRNVHVAEAGVAPPRPLISSWITTRQFPALALALSFCIVDAFSKAPNLATRQFCSTALQDEKNESLTFSVC